jgi:hypothetical protein
MPQNCREELNSLRARIVYPSSRPVRRSVRWCARGQVHDPEPEWLKMPRRQFLASRVVYVAQADEWICAAEVE